MSRQDHISNLFLDNESKLNERPPEMVWNRLEERLDSRKAKHKVILYRQAAAVAAMIVLISMVSMFTLFNKNSNTVALEAPLAKNGNALAYGEEEKPARPILMSHKERIYYRKQDLIAEVKEPAKETNIPTIEEHTSTKNEQLIAQNTNVKPRNSRTNEAYGAEGIITPESSIAPKTALEDTNLELTEEVSTEYQASPPSPMTNTTTSSPVVSSSKSDIKLERIPKDELPVGKPYEDPKAPVEKPYAWEITTTDDLLGRDKAMKEKELARAETESKAWLNKDQKKEVEKKKKAKKGSRHPEIAAGNEDGATLAKESAVVLPSSPSFMDAEEELIAEEAVRQSIDQFTWILGEWKDAEGNSIEKWTRTDGSTLVGQGYYYANGVKQFSEKMAIKQMNNKVYFMVTVEDDGAPIYLPLISFDGQIATFINEKNSFPQEVVIQKISNNQFQTTLNSNSSLNAAQQSYLSNRNFITIQNATRNMNRSQK